MSKKDDADTFYPGDGRDEYSDNVEIFSTEDERIKSFGELLTNDSSRAILQILLTDEQSASQLAQRLKLSLPLVAYHLGKMQEMDIIKVSRIEANVKGHDMKYYRATKFAIVILPSAVSERAKGSKSLLRSFKTIYRFAGIGIAGVAAWLGSASLQVSSPKTVQSAESVLAGEAVTSTSAEGASIENAPTPAEPAITESMPAPAEPAAPESMPTPVESASVDSQSASLRESGSSEGLFDLTQDMSSDDAILESDNMAEPTAGLDDSAGVDDATAQAPDTGTRVSGRADSDLTAGSPIIADEPMADYTDITAPEPELIHTDSITADAGPLEETGRDVSVPYLEGEFTGADVPKTESEMAPIPDSAGESAFDNIADAASEAAAAWWAPESVVVPVLVTSLVIGAGLLLELAYRMFWRRRTTLES